MRIPRLIVQTAIAGTGSVLFAWSAHAIDLTGVWASDAAACSKMFVTKGNKTSFRQDADLYGSGFIIDGGRIRGRIATCNVTRTNESNGVVHMIAACATDVMLSSVQFSVKVLDENTISRIFPGVEGMEVGYYRCPPRSGSMLITDRQAYAGIDLSKR